MGFAGAFKYPVDNSSYNPKNTPSFWNEVDQSASQANPYSRNSLAISQENSYARSASTPIFDTSQPKKYSSARRPYNTSFYSPPEEFSQQYEQPRYSREAYPLLAPLPFPIQLPVQSSVPFASQYEGLFSFVLFDEVVFLTPYDSYRSSF